MVKISRIQISEIVLLGISYLIFFMRAWIFMRKETSMNFLTDPKERRSTLDQQILWCIGG